ncbi:LysR family transcriptional regulator [Bacillus salitolerans]|uniref:LysR family transcriptional regulator n=1 Tax=Bacillus salitolerans TaxID=1437434 RepID=A0ABW4LXN1_9BACI
MSIIDIRHLVTFKTIVEQKTFTNAAAELKYAQSTLTLHIKMLEEEMGAPLFDRFGKKLSLTQAGRELYPLVQELLQVYERIKAISDQSDEVKGEIRIGASETVTVFRMQPVLAYFKKQYPNVDVLLLNDSCPKLREKVKNGELDIALILEPEMKQEDLYIQSIIEEPIVFIGGKDTSIQSLGSENRELLSHECFIFSEGECSLRRAFQSYLKDKKIAPKNTVELSSMEAIKQCVSSGLGLSIMPLVSAQSLLDEGKIKIINHEEGIPVHFTQIVYHRNKWLSPALQKFMEAIYKYY